MTRINTNVSSLNAQKTLARSNAELQQSLTRLSTGLRINTGKDDPAGLIASEVLRSDITSVKQAITNSERANQMIATADSALGQVSGLLNDIRGLVSEAANTGALSQEQIKANQLQVDSSLEAIDRIAQVTAFQGKRLLDGNMDFVTEGIDNTEITDLQIDQANFGTQSQIDVSVDVQAQATKGTLTFDAGSISGDVVLEVGGSNGYEAFSFADGSSITDMAAAINLVSDALGVTATAEGVTEWEESTGSVKIQGQNDNSDLIFTAASAGEAAGAYDIKYVAGTGTGTTATITESSVDADGNITAGEITISLQTQPAVAAEYTMDTAAATAVEDLEGSGAFAGDAAGLHIVAKDPGSFAGGLVKIEFADAGNGNGTTYAYTEATNTYVVTWDWGTADLSATAIAAGLSSAASGPDAAMHDFTATGTGTTNAVESATTYTAVEDTAGADGFEGGAGISATALAGGVDANFSVVIEDNAGGATTYDAASNTYTVQLDIAGGTRTLDAATLVSRLNNATGDAVAHAFSLEGAGDLRVNADGYSVTVTTDVAGEAADPTSIVATANDVIDAINTYQTANSLDVVSVTNATGSDGTGVVTISEVTALIGDDPVENPDANNLIQLQSLDGMRDIRFVNGGRNQSLSIDMNSEPPVYAAASAIIDTGIANGTFEIFALEEGSAGNQDITINWAAADLSGAGVAATAAFAGSTLTITIDNSGGAATGATVDEIIEAINVGGDFGARLAQPEVEPATVSTVGDGSGVIANDSLPTVNAASLEGGVVSEGVMIVNLGTDGSGNVTTTANDLIAFINSSDLQELKDFEVLVSNASGSDGTGTLKATTSDISFDEVGVTYTDAAASTTTHAGNGTLAQFTVTAKEEGAAWDDVLVRVVEDSNLATGTSAVTYLEDSKTLLVTFNGTVTAEDVSYTINEDDTVGALFTAEPVGGEGTGTGNVADGDFGVLSGGVTRTVDSVNGPFQYNMIGNADAGTSATDAKLTFSTQAYGSSQFVSVKALQGSFAVTNAAGTTVTRSEGTDVDLRINGVQMIGEGLMATLNTSSLDMSFSLDATVTAGSKINFSITSGGAQFQLGPDVVSNQQARLGIQSVSTATLGGATGRLFQLRSGGTASLETDSALAAKIVDETITQVTTLRGRLGAFQKTTLETNINSLSDTLENLTEAESSIRDADFAEESANLTRAQILVQSGTSVLSMANQNPQNVLSLLR